MYQSINLFCDSKDKLCSVPILDRFLNMVFYKTSIKYSHHRLQDIVVSDVFGDNIYHHHNLQLLDHLYGQNVYNIKEFLNKSYPTIHFIFCYKEDLKYLEIVLSIHTIYIIYDACYKITNIIGIDSRSKYSYNLI